MKLWWQKKEGNHKPWKRIPIHSVADNTRKRTGRSILFSRKLLTNIGLAALATGGAGLVFLMGLFWWVGRDMPNPNALIDRSVAQSTKIYDRTGDVLLYEVHGGERRTMISFSDIPQDAINALVSAEDDGFYEHHGIDIKGIIRSVVMDVLTLSKKQGASTITQQLVKNAILSSEKTFARKVREIVLSLRIESRFSKEEILQMYFNEVPFGSTNYGIESAARSYFGKKAKDLTLSESVTLMALVKAPTRYMNNPDLLKGRRDYILDGMVVDGYLSQEEADATKQIETIIQPRGQNILAPHAALYVKQKLEEQYGTRMVEEGGLIVKTTIDATLQQTAQEAAAKAVQENGEKQGFSNMAITAIDPATGQILAWVGSHDYNDKENGGAINMVVRPRQPGSSIKPLVYTALFEKGYTPNSVLYDVETDFPTDIGTYHPRNANLGEYGPVSIRKALQGSLNIPAVQAMYLVGVEPFLKFAEKFGYTTFKDRSRFGLSVAIGGAEVTLLEHTSTYATLAAGGIRRTPALILSIQDARDQSLYEWKLPQEERVVDSKTVDVLSDVLADDASRGYIFGTGTNLTLKDRKVAAKTGTTNDYKDGWTMGYVPQVAVGVWAGNNNNKAMHKGFGGSTVASGTWNEVMRKAVEGKEPMWYAAPQIPLRNNPALDGLIGTEREVVVDRMTGKLATDETPLSTRERRTYVTHHTTLHYVNREDPLSGPPADPTRDPMYRPWEQGVMDWVRRQQEKLGTDFRNEEPPTEVDDVHGVAFKPQVSILTPTEDASVSDRRLVLSTIISAPRRMQRADVFVDQVFVGSMTSAPYQLHISLPSSLSAGKHRLRVIAYDDVENAGEAEVNIFLPEPTMGAWIRLTDPVMQQVIQKSGSPSYRVGVEVHDPSLYSRFELYQTRRDGSFSVLAGIAPEPTSSAQAIAWSLPDSGDYELNVIAIPRDGSASIESGSVLVRVE